MRSEFDFISNIKKKYSLGKIGDDCAVLPKDEVHDLVVTADLLVEDIDFRLEWTTPGSLGHKALAVSLSDIAAMGAEPKWAMLSIAVPESLWNSSFLDIFYDGWQKLAAHFGVELVGGDISKTPDKFVIDSIVGGEVAKGKAVRRSGAKAGDYIYVSGSLGAAAAGLQLLESGARSGETNEEWKESFLSKHLRPSPQIGIGKLLQKNELATAMIDISDGLSSDLRHLCRAGGTGATIRADDLPFDGDLFAYTNSIDATLALALNGGEDFELLFAADPEKISSFESEDIYRIGEITANAGVVELIRDGKPQLLEAKGHRHF